MLRLNHFGEVVQLPQTGKIVILSNIYLASCVLSKLGTN
jgi:hypothetical protein